MLNKTTAVTGSRLSVQQEIENVSVVFSSKNFIAYTQIHGINPVTGLSFVYSFTFDSDDPEFLQMLNDYGARKSADIVGMKEPQLSKQGWAIKIADSFPAVKMVVRNYDDFTLRQLKEMWQELNAQTLSKVKNKEEYYE